MVGARAGWWIGGCVLLSSCLTTPMQRAETLGKKNYEVGIEAGLAGLPLGGDDDQIGPLPSANLAFRYGVSDRVDLGFRLGTTLYELQSKIRLNNLEGSTPISLAPSASVVYGQVPFSGNDAVGLALIRLPLLIGVPVGDRHELTIGPGLTSVTGWGPNGVGSVLEPRVSLGFNAQVSNSVRLHPEFGVAVGAVGVGDEGVVGTAGNVRWSGSLGLAVGRLPHQR